MEVQEVVEALLDQMAQGRPAEVVITMDACANGSRAQGSWMLVDQDGLRRAGTVGGGTAEARAIRRARDLVSQGASALDPALAGEGAARGDACAAPQMAYLFVDAQDEEQAFAWARVARVFRERRQNSVFSVSVNALAGGQSGFHVVPRLMLGDGSLTACALQDNVFFQPLSMDPVLYVVGCGNVGARVAKMALLAGFDVCCVDVDAQALAPFEDECETLRSDVFVDELADRIGSRDLVFCSTSTHPQDYAAVKSALCAGAGYVGCMGSPKKTAQFAERLGEDGLAGAAAERLFMPVGLPIGGSTPGAIAVSVVAQMVAWQSGVLR